MRAEPLAVIAHRDPDWRSADEEEERDPALLARLRQRLIDAGFSEARIRESYGAAISQDPWSLATGLPPRDGSPFSILTTLFCSGSAIDARAAETALAPLRLADLEKLDLVDVRDGRVEPRCLLRPDGDLIVASDLPTRRSDCVLGIVPATETLAHLTVRRPAKRALDLGTGCGAQALLLARHSETVVAVDVNPRALGFASFNAALNGITNMQWREGSWFAPVVGERFDLIACNPPYVISPDAAFTYRDGALPRDAVCRMVVRGAAEHLSDGGFATILCNWVHDDAWADTLRREWIEGTGCDALLLHYGTVDPAAYAARWNAELVSEPRRFEATVRRWIDYYRAEGISGIALGAVVLHRRRSATNWVRALEMAAGPTCASSDHLLRLFEAADFLDAHADGAGLLARAYALVDGHRLDQTLEYRAGKYAIGPAIFRVRPGIGVEVRSDPRVLEVLLECDGRRSLRELVADAVARRGDSDGFEKLVEQTSRQLIARGFMVAVPDHDNGGATC
jgi:hypothetical protein